MFFISFRLYLSGGFGSLIKRVSTKFEKKFLKIFEIEQASWVKVLPSSVTLKSQITVLFGIPRDLRDSHNSLGLPVISGSFFLKNACFFVVINFEASYLAFLYNSLSILSLDFLNFLKSLSLAFSFSKTPLSNHFWVFPFICLFQWGAILSITVIIFWMKLE